MKNTLKTIATVVITAVMLTGCSLNKNKNAVIIINDKPITKQQYEKEFNMAAGNPMFKQMGVDLKADPNGFINLMLKDRVVNEIIVKSLLNGEIEKRKIKVSNADIDKELKDIIDKIGSKEKFNEILKQNGVSPSKFKEDLKEEVKIKKLVESLALVNITDEMIKKYYNENPDKFKYPDKVRASHILISADPDRIKEVITAREESKNLTPAQIEDEINKDLAMKYQKAEKLLAEVKKDTSKFAIIAKENSDDPGSAQQGGDLGYFAADEMVESFSKAAFSLRPSNVSGIVKSPYGYHIIFVKDRIAAGKEPLDKVKNDIKFFLENQEKSKILQQFLIELKNNAKIEYPDPTFNPDEIQKKIKEQAKDNPLYTNPAKSAKE